MYFLVPWVVIFSFYPRRAAPWRESTLTFGPVWRCLTPFKINTYEPSASVDSKPLTGNLSPLDATLTKNLGGGGVIPNQAPEARHPSARRLHVSVAASSSIFRTFFQVPYPVTPLFATLTKTAGVWGYSSHFGSPRAISAKGTHYSKVASSPFLLLPKRSNFQTLKRSTVPRFQLLHQPRNNHLPENHRIGPHFHLPPQVSALRIDPRLLRHVPAVQYQIEVRNRHLCIQDTPDDQHRHRRFSEELLIDKRQLRESSHHVVHVVHPFDDGHEGWRMVEQILPVSKHGVQHVILLKEEMSGRGLRAHGLEARPLDDGQLRSPVCAPTHAVNGNSRLIHFRPGLQIVEHAREHAIRCGAYFDGRLPGARPVDRKKTDPVRNDGAEVFGKVFFAAVQAADCQHQRHGALRIFRQPQIADDLGAFKWNVHDL